MPGTPIPVRAKALGYYGDARRKAGDVFEVADESEVGSWMVRLDAVSSPAPVKASGAPKKDSK